MFTGMWRIALYVILVLAPLAVAVIHDPGTEENFIFELGKGFALAGFMILMLQPVLAGRFRWIERAFGLDILIRFHRNVAIVATGLLVLHPLLLTAGEHGLDVILKADVPWYIWLGRAALIVLLVNMATSLFGMANRLAFERWRLIHDILAPLLLVFIFVHSSFAGEDLENPVMGILWVGMMTAAAGAFVYHRLIRPRRLRRDLYQVVEVVQETKDVWTIKLAPPAGTSRYDYLPGQFQFLTLHREPGLPVEEHHWTISSSPASREFVSSTIKNLGDFTSTIGKTRAGDRAVVHAPFGRFSYLLHPGERDLVFIAGGIGVTPLMSMLRYMRDTASAIPVTFLYGNASEDEIVFRRELDEMTAAGRQRLTVVHVLEQPGSGWQGETGYIDEQKIRKYCETNLQDKGYYVCGPPGLLGSVLGTLKRLGVPDRRIHVEVFSFVD